MLTDWMPFSGLEFSCHVTEGEVVPGGSVHANVTYTPTVVDSVSIHYLSLKCKGALIEPLLKLTGSCVGMGCTTHTYSIKTQIFSAFYKKFENVPFATRSKGFIVLIRGGFWLC